ncbi:MAG: marine proteobacterial sortase target protein [gamma proteobacterium symbiont of Ctena orbiculata]|nr:MAG: marine proteobacterial sortase target protein [gamma proteobacterium symbiont of Ctena orbiculata]
MRQRSATSTPQAGQQDLSFSNKGLVRDLLLTLLAAVFTGLSGSILLILLVFGWSSVEANSLREEAANLQLRSLDGQLLQRAPLMKSDLHVDINGMLARVRVEHRFINPSSSWMEGIYQFPLPESSAVERLRMQIGEHIIEGRIEEKREARRIYRKARNEGKKASLLSQQRANIFSASLSNIAPGEKIRVAIEFQQQVRYAQGRFELRLPLVVAPRYIPGTPLASETPNTESLAGWARDTDQVMDASQITPPVIDPRDGVVNPVSLRVRLNPGLPLQSVDSHYHQMMETVDREGVVHLRLADDWVPAERDFLLSWQPQPGYAPRSALFTEHWQGDDYALLMILPPDANNPDTTLKRDLIFVIDHSGSMHGTSMVQAKAALKLAIGRLKTSDRFNLIGFNNRSRSLFSSPQPATSGNLGRASRFIDRLQAEGGTEMYPALEKALGQRDESGRLRQVVFLTDGSVGNERALFDLIRRDLGENRLFTVGIGSAPNSLFMQRAAAYGRGSFIYIGDLDEVADRMQSLLEKLEHPAMSHINIAWQGPGDIEVEPRRFPDLYLGEPLMIAIKGRELRGSLVIEGSRGSESWRQVVNLESKEEKTGLHTLWARRRIASLLAMAEDEMALGEKRQAVLDLALRHQLVSPYTSLVAVEKRVSRTGSEHLEGGMMPVNLPAGWHAGSVFGELPQTASRGPLVLLLGGLLLLVWMALFRQRRIERPSAGLFKC